MKLFYVPRTRATRPRWLLEELGVPYDLVRLDPARGETRTPEHLARQPLGHVPALEDGPLTVFESAAICLHLADAHLDKGLIPPLGTPGRARCYQWILYALTEMEPPLSRLAALRKVPEAERDHARIEVARADFARAAAALEPVLAKGPWLLGDRFSVADVVAGAVAIWGTGAGVVAGLPGVEDWVRRLRERPAFRRATAD